VSIERSLAAGRRAAERRMRATCTIGRPGEQDTDADGRVVTPVTPVYAGKCYLRYPGLAFEQNADSQAVTIAQSRVVVRIPFGTVVRPGDVVTVTADLDNPQLAGTVLRVASVDDQSQATAQRLLCEDNQSGVL
jgi:hypothetical protein